MGPNAPWLARLYRDAVPRPHTNAIAEEVFQSGIIPSDTDYRIYRDYGEVPGIDMAWFENGYVYHTHRDAPDQITAGSLQHTGENVLALIRAFAALPTLGTAPDGAGGEGQVFFDIFGSFMVLYSRRTAFWVNSAVMVLAMAVHFWPVTSRPREAQRMLHGLRVFGSAFLLGIAAPTASGLLFSCCGLSMRWYGHPWLLLGIYVLPSLLAHYWYLWRYGQQHDELPAAAERRFSKSVAVFWTVFLALCTAFNLAAGYVACWSLVFPMLVRAFGPVSGPRLQPGGLARRLVVGELVPAAMTAWSLIRPVLAMFVPLMGRSGTEIDPNLLLGVIIGICTMLVSVSTSSILFYALDPEPTRHSDGAPTLPRRLLFAGLALWAATVAFSHVAAAPYTEEPPRLKRLFLQHVIRTIHGNETKPGSGEFPITFRDSGVWVNVMDYSGIDPIREIPEFADLEVARHEGVYGGWPWMLPLSSLLPHSWYLKDLHLHTFVEKSAQTFTYDAQLAHVHVNVEDVTTLTVHNQTVWPLPGSAGRQTRLIHFTATGPDHMTLYGQPCNAGGKTAITRWSFSKRAPQLNRHKGEYFIYLGGGTGLQTWNAWIELEEGTRGKRSSTVSLQGQGIIVHVFTNILACLSNLVASLLQIRRYLRCASHLLGSRWDLSISTPHPRRCSDCYPSCRHGQPRCPGFRRTRAFDSSISPR